MRPVGGNPIDPSQGPFPGPYPPRLSLGRLSNGALPLRLLCAVSSTSSVCGAQRPSASSPHTHQCWLGSALLGVWRVIWTAYVCALYPDPVRITSEGWAGADVTMAEPAPHLPGMWPREGCTLGSGCHRFWICELGRLNWSQVPFALLSCDFWLEENLLP